LNDAAGPLYIFGEKIWGYFWSAELEKDHVSGTPLIVAMTVVCLHQAGSCRHRSHPIVEEDAPREKFTICHLDTSFGNWSNERPTILLHYIKKIWIWRCYGTHETEPAVRISSPPVVFASIR
jgi:hypothetical protein